VLPNLLVIDGGLAMTCSFGQTLPRTVHQLQKMAIMLVVEKDVPPTAPFLKYCTQKCASDASAVLADDPTPRVWLDG
jgi:hypothetical protein